jgi:two-component system, sensor histidine kinase and response regulator
VAKVLVVDDVAGNVELLAYALEDQGYDVLKVYSGLEALKVAASSKPDVIILDVMMPGIDGIEVCRQLKANPELTSIPVIMVSALESDVDLMKGLDAGAQDYIIKPYNVLVAMARVQIALAEVRSAAAWKVTADALREREKRFQAVFNQTFQFMGLLDPAGTVLEVNRAALACIGHSRENVVGQLFWKNPWWGDSPRVEEQLKAAVAAAALGRIINFEVEHRGSDGEPVHLDLSLMPVTDEPNRVVMLLAVGHDNTDRKRAEVEMLAAKLAAEAGSQSKGEFLANVSHEIRTPMNAILGMTELTLDSELNHEQRENLDIVRSATGSLLSIINDLLDFSKIEAGKLELDAIEFGLRSHIGDILALLGRRAHAKGIELIHRIDPVVPDQLMGDPARLRQVIVNLVGNAIKFTERGEVIVYVDLGEETPAEGNVRLHCRVTDTGIGIPADRLEAIFAPFTQADGSTTRNYGGTGLGLAISSQLVRLMNGRLWVESEFGRGSTFHFTLRLARSGAVRSVEPASPERRLERTTLLAVDDGNPVNGPIEPKASVLAAPGQPPRALHEPSPLILIPTSPAPPTLRILMAEDNPFNQRVASLMLAKLGHVVTATSNGREAVAALAGQSFDLILMDLQMPMMDGFQATAAIRSTENGTGRHIPIIAVTAHAMKEDRQRCLEAGMDGYVSKPIDQDKLREAIEDSVSLIREPPPVETSDGESASPVDAAAALARVDGDQGFLGEMAGMFLEESPHLMALIRQAVAAHDPAGLVAPAHTLKNWTGNFVAQAAFDAVTELEALGRARSLSICGTALARLEREIERLGRAMAQFDGEPARPDGDVDLSAVTTDSRRLPCTL